MKECLHACEQSLSLSQDALRVHTYDLVVCSFPVNTGETLFQIAISQQPRGVVRTHFVGLSTVTNPSVDTSDNISDEEVVVS